MWSSAAGVHLLQGSMCCVFRDGVLQILVVKDHKCYSMFDLNSRPD